MAQVNFSIPDDLKEAYDKALSDSGAENKPEFFGLMIRAFTAHQDSTIDTDIDLSKYESVNNQTKQTMNNAFKHILSLLDGNLSTTKAEAIYIDAEKKALANKEEAYRAEIEKISADTNKELLTVKAEHEEMIDSTNSKIELLQKKAEELETKNTELIKEFENVSKVADQVQFISRENKELREQLNVDVSTHKNIIDNLALEKKVLCDDLNTKINTLDQKLITAQQSLFVATVDEESKNKELLAFEKRINAEAKVIVNERKEFNKKLLDLTSELSEVKGNYNKALGKLEILETVVNTKPSGE